MGREEEVSGHTDSLGSQWQLLRDKIADKTQKLQEANQQQQFNQVWWHANRSYVCIFLHNNYDHNTPLLFPLPSPFSLILPLSFSSFSLLFLSLSLSLLPSLSLPSSPPFCITAWCCQSVLLSSLSFTYVHTYSYLTIQQLTTCREHIHVRTCITPYHPLRL